jgi:hypothetical protein
MNYLSVENISNHLVKERFLKTFLLGLIKTKKIAFIAKNKKTTI